MLERRGLHGLRGEECGTGVAGKRDIGKGKQRMVECKEVEDEGGGGSAGTDSGEEQDDDEVSEEEEEEEEEEEYEVAGGHQMLWTCGLCNTTINIFA